MRTGWGSALTCCLAAAAYGADPAIAQFWQNTKERLAREPLEATVKDRAEPLPYKTYTVEYRSLGGVRVRALLAMPIRGGTASGRLPAIVTAPGYGGTQQGIMLSECQRGYAILQVYPRSQGLSAELWTIDGKEKLTHGIAQPEGAYYQLAYADVLRGVDYLLSRDDVDGQRIGIAGTSQGGGIALAVAALDPRLRVVVAHVPFLCDMRQAGRTPGALVRGILDAGGVNTEAAWRTLDYFDPLQLVDALRAPALISSGGRDTVCPATTIQAVFARIPGVKSLFHDPELTHTTSTVFYQQMWPWLDRYLKP